jgi:DNA repair photolyase
MSSFLSNSTSAVTSRRRLASQPQLFPVGPQPSEPNMHGPKQVADRGPAPIAIGPGESASQINVHAGAAGCPPPYSGAAPAVASAEPGAVARCGDNAHHHSVQVRDAKAPLVGIARLAASSPSAESGRKSEHRPEYFFLPVRSILNKCDSNRVPFEWTINPYRGCEFACKYCYARYTHEYMELDGSEFERKIFVKQNPAELLARDVERKYSYQRAGAEDGRPEHIAIGTATDPYQPAEKEYKVTRACLEELAKREGLSVSVITKSNQIVRDIDVLQRIAARSELSLNITVTTLRTRLARLLEPRAPRPDLRIDAIRQLKAAGLRVGVSASPLIPGITDREGDLEAVAAAVKDAGAEWFFSGVLFLMPSSAKTFLPFIREKFPKLARQYEQWYSRNGYAPEEYRRKIAERVAKIRMKHGFHTRPFEELQRRVQSPQLSLAWNTAA